MKLVQSSCCGFDLKTSGLFIGGFGALFHFLNFILAVDWIGVYVNRKYLLACQLTDACSQSMTIIYWTLTEFYLCSSFFIYSFLCVCAFYLAVWDFHG